METQKNRKLNEALRIYANKELMNETNFMFVRLKKYIHHRDKYPNVPAPTVEELDILMNKIIYVLKKDSQPMRKS